MKWYSKEETKSTSSKPAVNVFMSRFVQTADSFRNSVNGSLFESLVHMIRSKHGFIQKLNTAVFLRDTQQFCCGFLGNIFVGKTEQKHIILCWKYSTIITSYLLNCCIKSHLPSVCSSWQKQHSCDTALPARVISLIVWYKYETKTHTGAFLHQCIKF